MDNFLFVLHDDILNNNSVLEFYPKLNSNVTTYIKSILFQELSTFLDDINNVSQFSIFQGFIFTYNNTYQFMYDHQEVIIQNYETEIFDNPIKSALFFQHNEQNIEKKYSDFQRLNNIGIEIEDFILWKNYLTDNKTDQFYDLNLSDHQNTLLHQLLKKYDNYQMQYISHQIDLNYYLDYLNNFKNRIDICDCYFMEFYYNDLHKNKQLFDLAHLFREISLRSYYFSNDDIAKTMNNVYNSLLCSKNEISQILSFNVIDLLLKENNPAWDLSIPKIMYKIIENNKRTYNLSNSDTNAIISVLTYLKKVFGSSDILCNYVINLDYNTQTSIYLKNKFDELYSWEIKDINRYPTIEILYKNIVSTETKQRSHEDNPYEELVKLENLVTFYIDVLTMTNLDPDDIVEDRVFSNWLHNNIEYIQKTTLTDNFDGELQFLFIDYFDMFVEFATTIFADIASQQKLEELLDLLDSSDQNLYVRNLLIPRLLLFCASHFHDLNQDQVLEVVDLVPRDEYLTVPVMIAKLLQCLIADQTLTEKDMYYLNTYLGQEITDYTPEVITELVLSLLQLERQPKMAISQSIDATMSAETEVNTHQEMNKKSIIPLSSLTPLTFIPEVLVDLLENYRDLRNYLDLYVQYQVIRVEWQDLDSLDQSYQQVKNLQTIMRSLQKYTPKIRSMRQEYPQVVDDIVLDFLEIEILLEEHADLALHKLNEVQQTLQDIHTTEDDLARFNAYMKQAHTQLGLNYQKNHLIQ